MSKLPKNRLCMRILGCRLRRTEGGPSRGPRPSAGEQRGHGKHSPCTRGTAARREARRLGKRRGSEGAGAPRLAQCSFPQHVWRAGATTSQGHRPSSLDDRNIFPHGTGGWQTAVKVPAGRPASLLGWQMAVCSPRPHMAPPLCLSGADTRD